MSGSNRAFCLLTAVLTFAMLAGCAAPATTVAPAPTAAAPATIAATSAVPGPVSTAGAPAGNPTVLKIAYQGALTGPVAFFGVPLANAVQLAVSQAHSDLLATDNIDLQYLPEDDQVDPAQAPAVARLIIQDPAVVGTVGPIFGNTADAAGPLYSAAHLAMISFGTAAELTTYGWPYFRMIPNDNLQGAVAAQYMVKVLHANTIAVIDDGTQYGKGLGQSVAQVATSLGATIVVRESIDPNSQDFSPTTSKILANKAQATFMGAQVTTVGAFSRQLSGAGYKAAFLAPDGSLSPDFIKLAGPGAEGTYFTCQCAPVPAFGGPQTGPLAGFVSAYKSAYNKDPQAYTAEAFDAANLIIAAIRGGARDRSAVVDFLHTHTVQGITKTYKFQPNGELGGSTINIYQATNGQIKWLGTSDTLIGQ